ncbi:MAG: hypothetical protein U5L02_11215 [Rheinheimera sp.]|nr:hypothetical protein [Rheinheimera sp.]
MTLQKYSDLFIEKGALALVRILPQSEHLFWFKMNTCSGFM